MLKEFEDLKHSVIISDKTGKQLACVDKSGVKIYSEDINICVCKVTGQYHGWDEEKMIYMSEGLKKFIG